MRTLSVQLLLIAFYITLATYEVVGQGVSSDQDSIGFDIDSYEDILERRALGRKGNNDRLYYRSADKWGNIYPQYNMGVGKRSRPYSFGLGKRDSENDLDLEADYNAIAGKQRRPSYIFGLGKRETPGDMKSRQRLWPYTFGLGKRETSGASVRRADKGYNFGLGKR